MDSRKEGPWRKAVGDFSHPLCDLIRSDELRRKLLRFDSSPDSSGRVHTKKYVITRFKLQFPSTGVCITLLSALRRSHFGLYLFYLICRLLYQFRSDQQMFSVLVPA